MAYNSYELETIETLCGTITPTLHADTSLGDLTATIPTKSIESIDFIDEKIEDQVGIIEINTLRCTIKETRSATFLDGFWYEMITTCAENDYAMPEISFVIDEGSGDTHLFWGRVDPKAVNLDEMYLGATYGIRLVAIDLLSAVTRIKDVAWADFLTALKDGNADPLIAAQMISENPTGTPSSLGVTFAGTPGSTTYKYRVAARDASGEYVWSTEATVTDSVPVLNGSGDHNILQFTGMAAATDYAIYRTYVGGGSLTTGFIGVKGSGGSGTITFNDTGFSVVGDTGATQTQLCARGFVSPMAFFRVALELAFDQGYAASDVTYENEDIKMKVSSTAYSLENTYILFWKNHNDFDPHSAAEGNIPDMDYSEYFKSDAPEYFGNTYTDILGALGHLAKHFAVYPRYYYDVAGTAHRIELVTRGRFGTAITMDGGIIQSDQSPDTYLIPRTIRCTRAQRTEVPDTIRSSNYPPVENGDFDLDFAASFIVQANYDVQATPQYDYGRDFEKFYQITQNGTTVAVRMDGVQYYDYAAAGYVSASGETAFQEAWVKYFRQFTIKQRKRFTRKYGSIKATLSAVSSHANLAAARRTEIDDGVSTKTFYANQVKKYINTNTSEVMWIQQ